MSDTNSIEKFDFFINRHSGTVLKLGEAAVESRLREEFNHKAANITFINGNEITSSITEWVNNKAEANKGIIVGGGDGTVLSAVATLIENKKPDINFGVLPLGTQNLLSNHLGFSADFNQAIKRYKNTATRELDVGKINGKYFIYGLLLDNHSHKLFDGREFMRKKEYFKAFKCYAAWVLGALWGKKTELQISNNDGTVTPIPAARSVAVSNNKIVPKELTAKTDNPNLLRGMFQNIINKEQRCDGKLMLYAMTRIKSSRSLPIAILKGQWTKHSTVHVKEAAEFVIEAKNQQKTTRIVIDGEIENFSYPLKISLAQKAVRVITPAA